MYKVVVSKKSIQKILLYITRYREYYEELYIDSGLWNEQKITDGYYKEAEKRYQEIRDLIERKFSQELPSYPNNHAIIQWRTKILLIHFKQKENVRTIIDIDIR